MGIGIHKEEIIDFFKAGGQAVGTIAINAYGESINRIGEKAFAEAIELGIRNTIAALYSANVKDVEILRVVCEHWGIQKEEAEERLLWEKAQAAIRSLEQYLKLQGYSEEEIRRFIFENGANVKIRHGKELWKLKDNPEKLMNAVTKKRVN